MSLWLAFRKEGGFLLQTLRAPALWLLLLVLGVAGILAYRVPTHYSLDIGGGLAGGVYDEPYLLGGFNIDPEYDTVDAPTTAFRWTAEHARLRFPGAGSGLYATTLRVAAGQGAAETVAIEWGLAESSLLVVPLSGGPRNYHVLLPVEHPDIDLRFRTPPFQPVGDERSLGFAADRLDFAAVGVSGPAWGVLFWLGLCLVAGYALTRRWQLHQTVIVILGLVAIIVFSLLLARARLGLTTYAPRLAVVLVASYLICLVLERLFDAGSRGLRLPVGATEVRAVTALVVLAWIIRIGGLAHPQAYTSDRGLHINNLLQVTRGEIIFTENLPSEAGGGPAPYPPAQYLMLLPWSLVSNPRTIVEAGNSLADSLTIAFVWLLLRSAGASSAAALFSGGLYLFAMPLLVSLSIGEMANVWGQALVGPLFLVLYRWQSDGAGAISSALLVAVLAMAFLGHFGVFISLLIFFAIYLPLLLLRRGRWFALGLLVSLALAFVVVGYYSAFAAILLERGSPEVPFGFERIAHVVRLTLQPTGRIGSLVFGLGLVGLGLILREQRLQRLQPLVVAWWLSTLLSLGALLWTEQALRWEAFLFPALALCGGVALAALHRWSRVGQALAYGLLGLGIVRGAVLWYSWIATYQH